MGAALSLLRLLIRIVLIVVGFNLQVRLSARVYRRRLIRAGVPRAYADKLARDFRGIVSLSALRRLQFLL